LRDETYHLDDKVYNTPG